MEDIDRTFQKLKRWDYGDVFALINKYPSSSGFWENRSIEHTGWTINEVNDEFNKRLKNDNK